jgi:UDP-glucose 4-epimerase
MYLITGGAGFIGSNIAEYLLKQGKPVRIFDNFSTGKEENIADFLDDVELVRGDLRDLDAVRKAAAGVEFILHQGALPSVPISVQDPIGTNDSNVGGTLNILVAARDGGVKRVVFASSCAIYGDDPALPKIEAMPSDPISPYALQKLAGEYYCRQFHQLYGLETVSLRYFNVYGKRQDPTSLYSAVIPRFLDAVFAGKPPTIFGDGEQTRDFIFVEDVVRANLAALDAKEAPGAVVNVASGDRLSINQIVSHISTILGREIHPVHEPEREGDIRHSYAETAKAESVIGFTAQTRFEDGLKKYIDWFANKAGVSV